MFNMSKQPRQTVRKKIRINEEKLCAYGYMGRGNEAGGYPQAEIYTLKLPVRLQPLTIN